MSNQRRRLTLYHLTPGKNVRSIQRNGLRAKSGNIFLFTDMMVADTIAKNQVFCRRYGVFSVDVRGLNSSSRIGPDNVGEFSAGYQRRLTRQAIIPPGKLSFIGFFDVVKDRPTPWDYMVYRARGWEKKVTDKWFSVMRASRRKSPEKANEFIMEAIKEMNSAKGRGPATPVDIGGVASADFRTQIQRRT